MEKNFQVLRMDSEPERRDRPADSARFAARFGRSFLLGDSPRLRDFRD